MRDTASTRKFWKVGLLDTEGAQGQTRSAVFQLDGERTDRNGACALTLLLTDMVGGAWQGRFTLDEVLDSLTEWMPGKDQLLAWVEASLADRHTARMVMNAVDDSCYVHLESKELTLTGAYGDLPVCAILPPDGKAHKLVMREAKEESAALAFRIVQDLVDLKADHHHLARRAATLDEQVAKLKAEVLHGRASQRDVGTGASLKRPASSDLQTRPTCGATQCVSSQSAPALAGCGEADAAAAAERQLDRGNQSGAGPDNGDGYGITEEDRAMDASIAKDLFQPRVVPARPGARHARGYTASRGMGRGRK